MNKILLISIIFIIATISVGAGFYFYSLENNSLETSFIENKSEISQSETPSCVITIDGLRYDVAEFRRKHPGGDIFKCGQDMTEAFYSQHGAKQLQQIQRYRIED